MSGRSIPLVGGAGVGGSGDDLSVTSDESRVVSDGGRALARPLGWWLKEADALLEAAFDAALEGTDVDRRRWQVLASLGRKPVARSALLAALGSFDPPQVLAGALDEVLKQGWVDESGDLLRLTNAGSAQQQALRPRVEQVRDRVSAALPQEDYVQLVNLLARLTEGLRSTS